MVPEFGDLRLLDTARFGTIQIHRRLGEPVRPEMVAGPLDELLGQGREDRGSPPVLADVRCRGKPIRVVQPSVSQRVFRGLESDN